MKRRTSPCACWRKSACCRAWRPPRTRCCGSFSPDSPSSTTSSTRPSSRSSCSACGCGSTCKRCRRRKRTATFSTGWRLPEPGAARFSPPRRLPRCFATAAADRGWSHTCAIQDINSTNGIYVKSNRVRRHYLNDGDVVLIGKHELIYVDERASRGRGAFTDTDPGVHSEVARAAPAPKTEHPAPTVEPAPLKEPLRRG